MNLMRMLNSFIDQMKNICQTRCPLIEGNSRPILIFRERAVGHAKGFKNGVGTIARPRAWRCCGTGSVWLAAAQESARFEGLLLGQHSLKAGSRGWAVAVNGDAVADPAGTG